MEQIDMSADAVTVRLQLVSELTKLCLSLKAAGKMQSEVDQVNDDHQENTVRIKSEQ